MRRLLLALVLVFGGPCGLSPAFAQDNSVPGEANWQVARFPDGAATVIVDVFELGGSQLANDQSAANTSNTDVWSLNVAAVVGYPTTCALKTYMLRWQPDAVNCSTNPAECVESTFRTGGVACRLDPHRQMTNTWARTPVSAQGISFGVIKSYARVGEEPIRWQRFDIAADADYTGPSASIWHVFFYSQEGPFPHIECVVPTASDPAVSLPSSASCAGN